MADILTVNRPETGDSRDLRVPANRFGDMGRAYQGTTWMLETANGKPVRRDYAYKRISETVLDVTGKVSAFFLFFGGASGGKVALSESVH
ncbi:MAG: hypothetical protein WCQ50_14425 [Spirochaetota bacterium]